MQRSIGSYLPAATALTAAAITAAPLLVSPAVLHSTAAPTLPSLSAPRVQLAALVSPRDIDDLVERLNSALSSVSSTVTSVVAMPGNSLSSVLDSAVAVNNDLWNNMIRSTDNRALVDLLRALRATSSGGLTRLSDTVADVSGTIVLTTGEVTTLLASTLTGSLSTALHAVASIINNPLSLSSYTGLLNVPLDVAGLVLHDGAGLVNSVGRGALSTVGTLATGVTSQIDNLLRGVNEALSAAKGLVPGVALLDGVLTAIQGIVTAPVSAALAGVNGLTGTLVDAAGRTLGNITHGVSQIADAWLGDGTGDGALQRSIRAIGSEPLSVASYTQALGAVVAAGVRTVGAITDIGTGLLSVPFTAGADLSVTAAEMVAKFNGGAATLASGLMRAAGLPSLVANLPHTVAGAVNMAVRAVGAAVAAGFNTVAAVLDPGSLTHRSAVSAAAPQLRQAAASTFVTADVQLSAPMSVNQARGGVDVADAGPLTASNSAASAASAPAVVGSAGDVTEADPVEDTAVVAEPREDDVPVTDDETGDDVTNAEPESANSTAADPETSTGGLESTDEAADPGDESTVAVPGRKRSATESSRSNDTRTRLDVTDSTSSSTDTGEDESRPKPQGRHASGKTAADSPAVAGGRHRGDSAGAKGTAGSPAGGGGSESPRAGGSTGSE